MSTPPGPEQPEQNPYGTPPPPYQQPYYQQPYAQQPYGQQPGYGFQPQPANHPSATTAMVLGIVGLVGIVMCGGITLVLSPAAWIVGGRAVRQIDAAPPGAYGGRDQANAGRIMGIIGTVLLALGILAIVGLIVLAVATSGDGQVTHCYSTNSRTSCGSNA